MAFRRRRAPSSRSGFPSRRRAPTRSVRGRSRRRGSGRPQRSARQQTVRIVIEQPASFDNSAAMLGLKVAAGPKKARF